MNLRCDLNDGFYICVRKPIDETEKKRSQTYLIDLFGKTTKKPIATKSVPWPSNEEAPSELLYVESEGALKLKNSITVAEIPLRLQNIYNRKEDSSYCKKLSSFSASITDKSSNDLISSVKAVVESPTSKTSWRELCEIIVSNESSCTLPALEQDELIQALFKNHNSKIFGEICTALRDSNILGYRKQQEFALFCIEHEQIDVIIAGLTKNVYSEEVKVKILKHITQLPSFEASNILEALLLSGFSQEQISIDAKMLTPKETGIILTLLSEIFVNAEKESMHSQALSLIAALIDAAGLQLVLEPETQKVIREIMYLVNEYAAVADLFCKFEVKSISDDSANIANDLHYRLRRIQIKPRKINW